MGCGTSRTPVVETLTATMKDVVPQGDQLEFPGTLMRETSIKLDEILRLRQLMMASSSEVMLADTAVPAEDPCEGDQTSIDESSRLSERKKDGRVSVRTCTQSLIAATGSRLNPEPFYQPAQGWLTLQDLAQSGRLMMELKR